MPAPTVHVDARSLDGERTGIGVFTAALLDHWPEGARVVLHHRRDHRWPWHPQVARAVRRDGGRYLSTDSLIVPVLLGRRATVTVHDLTPLVRPETQRWRTKLAFRLLLGLACRRVGAVCVPGEATRADLLSRYPAAAARVHVVPYAGRTLPPAAPLPAGVRPPYVLHTGTHEPRKRVVDLVEGFLRHVPEPWQLVLAGRPGWLAPEVAARLDAAVQTHPDRVIRLGFVSDETLAGLYAQAELFCYPSDYEGFGLPVVEAMGAGIPVVTTDTPAVAEVAAGASRVVPLGPDLANRLGTELAALVADPAARADLRARALARAADFDWARTAAGVHAATTGADSRVPGRR